MKILVLNGPNLNFLGIREKSVYGDMDYNGLVEYIKSESKVNSTELKTIKGYINIAIELDLIVKFNYHKSEQFDVDILQQAYYDKVDGIVINPGAYTHYSYAIFDAIKSIQIPTVEVHISNIHEREEFRKISVTSPACIHQIYGKGIEGYIEAVSYLENYLK